MLNYDKQYDIRRVLRNIVSEDDLLSAIFQDIPDLNGFTFSVISEYDDNNYSDSVNLTSVNGCRVNYDGEREEDEEEEKHHGLSGDEIQDVIDFVQTVGREYGHSDMHEVSRSTHAPRTRGFHKKDCEEIRYVTAYMTNQKLPDEFFKGLAEEKWAVYYADDHGRFSEDLEFDIFAHEGRMFNAYRYAREIIKGPLPKAVENFFILQPDETDRKYLQEYITWKTEKVQTQSA